MHGASTTKYFLTWLELNSYICKSMTILVTGGCGYIGAHTLVDLSEHGFDLVCVDNNSRSTRQLLLGVEEITQKIIPHYCVDLCDYEATAQIFEKHHIDGIIHFAAYKSVNESVEKPTDYYHNNLVSLINVLRLIDEFDVKHFVFSSSCSVYGNAVELPVNESTPLQRAESPYAATKQIGERMIIDFSKSTEANSMLLRYFNPVGAHPSNKIGEIIIGRPQNLIPAITQTAIGKLPQMLVHGTDYDTRDGSCIRDFIHVCDIAHAHTLALKHLINNPASAKVDIFNLGTGNGVTVLEAIKSFETVTGLKLNYSKGPRRPGDVVAVYANNSKAAQVLGWHCQYALDDMMRTAWAWEEKMAHAEV
ncbi:MAG: UDP-glucose 4-epimerase GalE [Bacteroidota bacterium]|jgi:UDP-glucose 4-epimerase